MKTRWTVIASAALTLILLATLLPACKPVYAAESLVAIVPRVLHSGNTEQLSIALINGNNLAAGDVEVVLAKDGDKVARVSQHIDGQGIVPLSYRPALPPVAMR